MDQRKTDGEAEKSTNTEVATRRAHPSIVMQNEEANPVRECKRNHPFPPCKDTPQRTIMHAFLRHAVYEKRKEDSANPMDCMPILVNEKRVRKKR